MTIQGCQLLVDSFYHNPLGLQIFKTWNDSGQKLGNGSSIEGLSRTATATFFHPRSSLEIFENVEKGLFRTWEICNSPCLH